MTDAPTLPFQAHSAISRDAARRGGSLASQARVRVLDAITKWGPLTDEQVANLCEMNPSTARPRRIELMRAGRIVQVGTAKTASGRSAALWSAVL